MEPEKFDPFTPMQKPKKSLEERLNQVGKIVRENDENIRLKKELTLLKEENQKLREALTRIKNDIDSGDYHGAISLVSYGIMKELLSNSLSREDYTKEHFKGE